MKLTEGIVKIVKEASKLMLTDHFEIESKSGVENIVTSSDIAVQSFLVKELCAYIPGSSVLSGEEGMQESGDVEYLWIIDPIDGTTNFIHGVPPHAISIALMEDQRIVVGVIYELCGRELFVSSLGGGAYLNGQQIHVSSTPKVADSLVSTGFPYSNYERMQQYMQLFMHLTHNSAGLRRHGSAATDLAYVAAGRFDAFFEYDLKPYDVAAGVLLVTEAGGRVADFTGGDNYIFGREIVASNSLIFDEFMVPTKEAFSK